LAHYHKFRDATYRKAWLVVGILFLGSVLNYMDRAVLGVVKPFLQRDLVLNNVQYGFAVNAFLATYTVFYIFGGRLSDRFGFRRMFSLNVLFWSISCALHSLVRGLGSLCLVRAMLGVGEGGYYPAAMRGAAESFGPEHRAKAVGVVLCGLTVGSLLTPPIVAWITGEWGWRASFLLTGTLGCLLIPPWLALHRGPALPAASTEPATPGAPLRGVLCHPKFLAVLGARAIPDMVWVFYLFWIPGYFQEVRGWDLATVGRLLWIPFFCADLGALGGAWASSALIQRGWSVDRGRKTILYLSGAAGMTGALVPFAGHTYLALALVSLVLCAQLSWSSNIHTTITEIAPARHMALLYGITGAAGNGLGGLSQPLVGYVVDHFGYAPIFLATGVAYLAAMICVRAAGKFEPIEVS
jgi:ACS family hexuronate transporter-like MFS transporter